MRRNKRPRVLSQIRGEQVGERVYGRTTSAPEWRELLSEVSVGFNWKQGNNIKAAQISIDKHWLDGDIPRPAQCGNLGPLCGVLRGVGHLTRYVLIIITHPQFKTLGIGKFCEIARP